MSTDFAISKERCQARTLPRAIGVCSPVSNNMEMIKPPARRPRRDPPPVYIGEWLKVFDLQATNVARDANINEGYLSQLISGQKRNPGAGLLVALAKQMPQPFHYTKFYEPPPDEPTLKALKAIDPALIPYLKPRS